MNSGIGPSSRTRSVSAGDHLHPFAPFGGGDPGELQAREVDADEFEQLAKGGEAAPGVEVAGHVVAVPGMAARDQHPVGPLLEGAQDEDRVDAAGAGELHHPHVGGVLQAAGAGQVGAGVGAPGADEGDDFRLEVVFLFVQRA